jgi:hypothetical protein
LLFGSLAHLGSAERVHDPAVLLTMCYESADADDRMVNVFGDLVADRLQHLGIGLAGKTIRRRKATQIGYGFNITDHDVHGAGAWHRTKFRRSGMRAGLQCLGVPVAIYSLGVYDKRTRNTLEDDKAQQKASTAGRAG